MNLKAFHEEVLRVMKLAEGQFNVDLSNVSVEYNLRGRAAGQVKGRIDRWTRRISELRLRFNKDAIRIDYDDSFNDTIPHEVAHLVCYVRPELGRNHDRGWKRVCLALGGTAQRCHSLKLPPGRRMTKHRYRATCGREHDFSPQMHRKIQRGQRRKFKNGGWIQADGYIGVVDKNGTFRPNGNSGPGGDEGRHLRVGLSVAALAMAQTAAKPQTRSKRAKKPKRSRARRSTGKRTGPNLSKLVRDHIRSACSSESDANDRFNELVDFALSVGIRKANAKQYVRRNIKRAFK